MSLSGEQLERLDASLASLARSEGALRLCLGQALEVMGRGAVAELGFSSVAAYTLERCERSARWAEGARCLARRVERLPELRRSMASGSVSWSMAELLARVAQPEDELRWLELAESRTVRQVRELVAGAAPPVGERLEAPASHGEKPGVLQGNAADAPAPAPEAPVVVGADASDEVCTLTCTVDREDAWLFEATRYLLGQLGVRGAAAQVGALLAEAQGALLERLPAGALARLGASAGDQAQRAWLVELRRWREQAEALAEKSVLAQVLARRSEGSDESCASVVALAAALGMAPLEHLSCEALDRHVRALSEALASHDLELARLLLRFHRADGWRRLGYATETQYGRERLGMSHSSLLARRALAVRLEKLPAVSAALGRGQLGIEAAAQLARVATAATEAAWVVRARRRTIKHLREEVAAALTAVRWSGEVDCWPPADAEMAAFEALERAVVSGQLAQPPHQGPADGAHPPGASHQQSDPPVTVSFDEGGAAARRGVGAASSAPRRAWLVMLSSLASWLAGGFQTSAAPAGGTRERSLASAGRVTLRLRMSRADAVWWRELERLARRYLPRGMSWLKFMCLSMWQAWQHVLGADVAYGNIYVRDRFRCTSPVCTRRDVTPHHLIFRSAGGSDAPANITSLCYWCHLLGVHGGRIRARGTAALIHWELGSKGRPCLVVHGRERIAQ